ncbi:flagellin [Pelosinus sp. IPA-1]|uniref:flagellin N-terminal helical domain-containing protein n=1 Tax=Pelosinus sp. IPA-1 TaxID=3029569 RepID=UPI0024361A32|nr:flagellin [Pelosinus sp. IPA-1]GMB01213.1 hypothetical protein PIPA1_40120 [Pelosinus sp. IPA-1]
MRITNGMVAANNLRNISKAENRLAAANAAVSSNQKIQAASDDPLVATRAVTYRSYVSQIAQYQDNTDAADGWQTATDDALSGLVDSVTTLGTLAGKITDTLSAADLTSMKTQVQTLQDEVISYMNTNYCGSYVFGGYSTGTAPYAAVSTDVGDTVTYKGGYLSLGGVVSADISDDDIKTFYTANDGDAYNTLTTASATALKASTVATAAAAAAPTDLTLAAKATNAKKTSDALEAAVATYGGTTNLTDAVAADKTAYQTLAAAVTTYGGTTTLTDATAIAKTAYDTASSASAADTTDTTLATTTATALTAYQTLTAAVTTYGGTTTLTDAAATAKTTYATLADVATNGDQKINYNIGFSSSVTVNTEGQDVVGEGINNLFNTIAKLQLALNGDTSYKTAAVDSSGTVTVTTNSLDVSDLKSEFATDLSKITAAQATLGGNMDRVASAVNTLSDASTLYKGLMTDNENIDTAAAATELTSAEYTYEAALAVGAKVTSKSLIDYIA